LPERTWQHGLMIRPKNHYDTVLDTSANCGLGDR
jgi:hypothetical protein